MQFTKGDDFDVTDDSSAIAGIHVGEHGNKIEVYDRDLFRAQALRDKVLFLLENAEIIHYAIHSLTYHLHQHASGAYFLSQVDEGALRTLKEINMELGSVIQTYVGRNSQNR